MAFYDNKHWLLLHIRNSFISSDDTGLCEMVMVGENIHRNVSAQSKFDCYPGVDESDDEDDDLSESFDIQSDIDFGIHRQRSNTAQRLEKMDMEKKKAAKIKHIKWETSAVAPTDEERAQLFCRKDFRQRKKDVNPKKHISLLSEQLLNTPQLPHNPFTQYQKYDGSSQEGVSVRKYGVFLMMLPPSERSYPLHVTVTATAKVQELIGFICWKYTSEHPDFKFNENVDCYGLYIAEDDGEVDWDFPCLDSHEAVAKFGFSFLALMERTDSSRQAERKMHESWPIFGESPKPQEDPPAKSKVQLQEAEDLQRMKGHMTAMEAPLYQSYRVYIINKMRTKTEIHLGISGEKLEIDPVTQQKVSSKFWTRQKAVSYDMDSVAACDLTDTKSSSRAIFRLVYHTAGDQGQAPGYKHHDFETDLRTAEEIVQKIRHILELRSSTIRKEYLAIRERKSHRRRSFHLGPR